MEVRITKVTPEWLPNRAAEMTIYGNVKCAPKVWYKNEHSPIRCEVYWIEMHDIPTFVSVHLVRHSVGVSHYVTSKRTDRGGNGKETRRTPVNHGMLINAQTLINMARKRLCGQASEETRQVMQMIKANLPHDLQEFLVPECVYRGGCHEDKPCGLFKKLTSEEIPSQIETPHEGEKLPDQWTWMMAWCKNQNLPPADTRNWEAAEAAYWVQMKEHWSISCPNPEGEI
jgi:hypothetical protein